MGAAADGGAAAEGGGAVLSTRSMLSGICFGSSFAFALDPACGASSDSGLGEGLLGGESARLIEKKLISWSSELPLPPPVLLLLSLVAEVTPPEDSSVAFDFLALSAKLSSRSSRSLSFNFRGD